ncbi:hypothetical protein AGMMS49579_15560 [Spirochaetia bacterium]|nr:hypothetical protein AGMMS49579_15560 [Spirochaetia bacterium]
MKEVYLKIDIIIMSVTFLPLILAYILGSSGFIFGILSIPIMLISLLYNLCKSIFGIIMFIIGILNKQIIFNKIFYILYFIPSFIFIFYVIGIIISNILAKYHDPLFLLPVPSLLLPIGIIPWLSYLLINKNNEFSIVYSIILIIFTPISFFISLRIMSDFFY